MLERRRVILEGSVDVRHTGMPGIAGIRKKAQIRQFKPLDRFAFRSKIWFIFLLLNRRMGEHESD